MLIIKLEGFSVDVKFRIPCVVIALTVPVGA